MFLGTVSTRMQKSVTLSTAIFSAEKITHEKIISKFIITSNVKTHPLALDLEQILASQLSNPPISEVVVNMEQVITYDMLQQLYGILSSYPAITHLNFIIKPYQKYDPKAFAEYIAPKNITHLGLSGFTHGINNIAKTLAQYIKNPLFLNLKDNILEKDSLLALSKNPNITLTDPLMTKVVEFVAFADKKEADETAIIAVAMATLKELTWNDESGNVVQSFIRSYGKHTLMDFAEIRAGKCRMVHILCQLAKEIKQNSTDPELHQQAFLILMELAGSDRTWDLIKLLLEGWNFPPETLKFLATSTKNYEMTKFLAAHEVEFAGKKQLMHIADMLFDVQDEKDRIIKILQQMMGKSNVEGEARDKETEDIILEIIDSTYSVLAPEEADLIRFLEDLKETIVNCEIDDDGTDSELTTAAEATRDLRDFLKHYSADHGIGMHSAQCSPSPHDEEWRHINDSTPVDDVFTRRHYNTQADAEFRAAMAASLVDHKASLLKALRNAGVEVDAKEDMDLLRALADSVGIQYGASQQNSHVEHIAEGVMIVSGGDFVPTKEEIERERMLEEYAIKEEKRIKTQDNDDDDELFGCFQAQSAGGHSAATKQVKSDLDDDIGVECSDSDDRPTLGDKPIYSSDEEF